MEYRHSSLWPQPIAREIGRTEQKAAALMAQHSPLPLKPAMEHAAPTIDEVNAHMQQWADAGWELVSANVALETFGLNRVGPRAVRWPQLAARLHVRP